MYIIVSCVVDTQVQCIVYIYIQSISESVVACVRVCVCILTSTK